MLVWGDFETHGLDPDVNPPLEFGMITTTDDLQVLDRRRYLFRYPREVVEALRLSCTFDAHEKNGLWDELLDPDAQEAIDTIIVDPVDFDDLVCAGARAVFQGEKPTLAGFGPHFDQRYLRRYAPSFLDLISYQLRDVRTIAKECAQRYPTDWGPKPCGPMHRALSDCEAAIAYLQWFRAHVMSPYNKALSFRKDPDLADCDITSRGR